MWRSLACLAVLPVAISACGSSGGSPATPAASVSVNPDAPLPDQIKAQLSGQNLKVTDIQCPSDVTREEGTSTSCTGTLAGQSLNFSVEFVAGNQILVTVVP